MKTCTKCKVEKRLEEFSKHKLHKNGLQAQCKDCMKDYLKKYYVKNKKQMDVKHKVYYNKNKEEITTYIKTYNIENKEELTAYRRTYREENKEEIAAKAKTYREGHKEERAAYDKKRREENLEEHNASRALYRARKLSASPSWANQDNIKAFYKSAQRVSKCLGIPHEVDHYYPLQGEFCCGLHIETNLQVIPATENRSKNNKMPEEFYNEENTI